MSDYTKKDIKKEFKNIKKRKLATLSTGIIIGFIAVVIAVNVVLNLLVERYPLKLDLTNEKIYELTDESINMLKSVKMPVEITFLMSKESLPKYFTELLANYRRYCDKLSIKYIDAVKNPDILKKEGFENLTSNTLLVVSSEKRYRGIEYTNLSDENKNSLAEQEISSAILYAIKDEVFDILLIEGHGETYSDSFKNTLTRNGYNVELTNIKNAKLSNNTKAIIINAPVSDFTADDIDALDKIMTNNESFGRSTFLFTGTQTPKLEKLENYIAEWGISLGTEKIVEGTSKIIPLYGFQILTFSDETDKKTTKDSEFYSFIGEVRPVNIIFEQKGNVTSVKPVLKSSSESFGKPAATEIKSASDLEKAETDKAGPFNVAAISTKLKFDSDNNKLTGNLIVSGTTAFSEDVLSVNYGNSRYLINLLNKAVGLEDSDIAIVAKSIAAEKLNIAGNFVFIFTVVFIFVIPAVIILAGVIIFMKRKHL